MRLVIQWGIWPQIALQLTPKAIKTRTKNFAIELGIFIAYSPGGWVYSIKETALNHWLFIIAGWQLTCMDNCLKSLHSSLQYLILVGQLQYSVSTQAKNNEILLLVWVLKHEIHSETCNWWFIPKLNFQQQGGKKSLLIPSFWTIVLVSCLSYHSLWSVSSHIIQSF